MLTKIDWIEFNQQKADLFELARSIRTTPGEKHSLEGVLNLMDHLQDEADRQGLLPHPHQAAIVDPPAYPFGRWTTKTTKQ